MAEITLPAFDPPAEVPADEWYSRDLYAWKVTTEWTWEAVLAMAVRDGAEAVHLHPWGLNHALTYKVGGTHYTLVPPRADTVPALLGSARRVLAPGSVGRSLAWLLRGRVCGRVRLRAGDATSEWVGVCWRGAGFAGAEFFRLDYAPPGVAAQTPNQALQPTAGA